MTISVGEFVSTSLTSKRLTTQLTPTPRDVAPWSKSQATCLATGSRGHHHPRKTGIGSPEGGARNYGHFSSGLQLGIKKGSDTLLLEHTTFWCTYQAKGTKKIRWKKVEKTKALTSWLPSHAFSQLWLASMVFGNPRENPLKNLGFPGLGRLWHLPEPLL